MRILITGGAGFIGSHLAQECIRRGYEVAIWDNLFRGKLENISHLLNDRNRFYEIDLADETKIGQMAKQIVEEKPVYIFHYAAINGTQYFYDIPAKVLEVNIRAVSNLMCALRKAKEMDQDFHTKVIYASSSEVYGEPFAVPTKETDVTYVVASHVRDSYAASKLSGEFYVKLISEEIGTDWVILRLFNVYGERMVGTKYGQVIPEFIERLNNGEYPLHIYGSGDHKRSFCYVSDNVKATLDLAESTVKNDIFNIGNANEVSILELGSMIMKKMGKEPAFCFLPEREGDHKRRCPDTDKLHAVIGKRTYMTLEEGLEKLLVSCKNQVVI
ncbi:MAG: SDR family NAD(P)-dependent oxidoreductase [Eubacterium sp.]|nr:SDR family NAD(P)-dependent oxidoreductase [Eubacterium sp.]